MATRKPMFLDEYGATEMAATDDIALGALAMSGNITMAANKVTGLGAGTSSGDALSYAQSGASLAGLALTADLAMGSQKITGMDDGTNPADGVNLSQLDSAVIQGGTRKEFLLDARQLDNAEGILGAMALTMANNPNAGATITLQDGVTTRIYGATSGGDVQYTIGATVADTMANLAAAITGDGSGAWDAYFTTDLDSIDTDGVVVIVEKDNDAGASELYGVWSTPADAQVVDFGGELDYTKKTLTTMQASDPASTTFGFNRTQASLTPGEIHYTEVTDTDYGWDTDADVWNQMSGGGSLPDATSASGGGVKGKVTFDRDFGLLVTAGVAKISVAASKGLSFDGSGNLQGVADTTAGMEVGANGFGIDIAATNPAVGFDGSGDLEFKLSGTTLGKDASGAKVLGLPLQFEVNGSAVATTVTQAALDVITGGTSSDADLYHTHNEVAAYRLEDEATAEENLAKGDPIEWGTTNDEIRQCRANTVARVDCFGVVEEAAGIAADATGTIVRRGPAVVLTGATVGDRYYVADTGGLVQGKAGIAAGNHVIKVGTAKNATELEILVQYIGRKAA